MLPEVYPAELPDEYPTEFPAENPAELPVLPAENPAELPELPAENPAELPELPAAKPEEELDEDDNDELPDEAESAVRYPPIDPDPELIALPALMNVFWISLMLVSDSILVLCL